MSVEEMRNYLSWSNNGERSFSFFDDEDVAATHRARSTVTLTAASVWRRPLGKPEWSGVPQIRGDFACAVGDLARRKRDDRNYDMTTAQCSCPRCRKTWPQT